MCALPGLWAVTQEQKYLDHYMAYRSEASYPDHPNFDTALYHATGDAKWLEGIEEIGELIEAGYLDRILMAQDTCLKTKLVRYGGQGYAHILRNILPQMRVRGITDEQIKALMVENPARLLCFS